MNKLIKLYQTLDGWISSPNVASWFYRILIIGLLITWGYTAYCYKIHRDEVIRLQKQVERLQQHIVFMERLRW